MSDSGVKQTGNITGYNKVIAGTVVNMDTSALNNLLNGVINIGGVVRAGKDNVSITASSNGTSSHVTMSNDSDTNDVMSSHPSDISGIIQTNDGYTFYVKADNSIVDQTRSVVRELVQEAWDLASDDDSALVTALFRLQQEACKLNSNFIKINLAKARVIQYGVKLNRDSVLYKTLDELLSALDNIKYAGIED
jgi:hypothetical protein